MARAVKSERDGAKTEKISRIDRCLFTMLLNVREKKKACDVLGKDGESVQFAILEGLLMQVRDDLVDLIPAYERAEAT